MCEKSLKISRRHACTCPVPNHQRWYAKWKLSWNMYTLHTRLCTFGPNLYSTLSRCLLKNLHRSSVGRLLVGTRASRLNRYQWWGTLVVGVAHLVRAARWSGVKAIPRPPSTIGERKRKELWNRIPFVKHPPPPPQIEASGEVFFFLSGCSWKFMRRPPFPPLPPY